jgi:hypothetical protein
MKMRFLDYYNTRNLEINHDHDYFYFYNYCKKIKKDKDDF